MKGLQKYKRKTRLNYKFRLNLNKRDGLKKRGNEMRWPPNAAWTSAVKREGYRHFEVKSYGGKKDERWVELFPVNNSEILIRVPWSELKTYSKWTSGWLQLPKNEDCEDNKI